MIGKEKIEGYLINLGLSYQEVTEDSWIINDADKGLENVIIISAEPLVIVRVKVMEVPAGNKEALYETLLKLNADDLIHGAYALEEGHIILLDTLEAGSLDLEELQASLDAIGMALSQHYQILSKYRKSA